MPRFSAVGGFQAGVVAIMVTYAAITLMSPVSVKASPTSPEPVQDEIAAPPSKAAMDELMKQKLSAAQRALEAVSREDYDQLHDVSLQMIALSHKEVWEQMASPRFVQDTADFVAAVEFMDRMATARDSEGVTLGFARLRPIRVHICENELQLFGLVASWHEKQLAQEMARDVAPMYRIRNELRVSDHC